MKKGEIWDSETISQNNRENITINKSSENIKWVLNYLEEKPHNRNISLAVIEKLNSVWYNG